MNKIYRICWEHGEIGGKSAWICRHCGFANENYATSYCLKCGKN